MLSGTSKAGVVDRYPATATANMAAPTALAQFRRMPVAYSDVLWEIKIGAAVTSYTLTIWSWNEAGGFPMAETPVTGIVASHSHRTICAGRLLYPQISAIVNPGGAFDLQYRPVNVGSS